jgi:hypothetical protein
MDEVRMIVSLELVIGVLAGMLPTLAVSRLVLLMVPRGHGLQRFFIANGASWLICTLLAAIVLDAAGEPYGVRAAVTLIFPQLCWMIFDTVRHQVGDATASATPAASQPARRRLLS